MKKIGVGIIGASPLNPGWAMIAHIPAIHALPHFELRAVSTSRRESAEAAARQFRVPAYDNADALIEDHDVDLVVVSVKTPDHYALIRKAIDAGKMVFCEWPLATNLEQAEDLAARANAAGVRTVIGLQARYAPAIRHARDLIAEGFIGEVLATTLVASAMAWGAEAKRSHVYWFDVSNGANVVSVALMHALEALNYVLGDFASVGAASAVRRSSIRVIEDGTLISADAPDHIAISGTLRSGAITSVFYRGGISHGSNFHWEINGTEGDLILSAPNGNVQVAEITLQAGRGSQTSLSKVTIPAPTGNTPDPASHDLSAQLLQDGGFGHNTLLEYIALAEDIRDETYLVPDFAYAVRRHQLLAAIEEAARTGLTQKII